MSDQTQAPRAAAPAVEDTAQTEAILTSLATVEEQNLAQAVSAAAAALEKATEAADVVIGPIAYAYAVGDETDPTSPRYRRFGCWGHPNSWSVTGHDAQGVRVEHDCFYQCGSQDHDVKEIVVPWTFVAEYNSRKPTSGDAK